MKVRHLRVGNFRGISTLDWTISGDVIALLGHGDAGKTTILDALGWVLSPTWWLPVSEADFFQGDISKPITVAATLVDLPSRLTSFDRFGLQMRGWHTDDCTVTEQPEPHDEVVPALTIRLTIDESFEPLWHVVKGDIELRIGAADRAHLGFFRIDDRSERHLAWGRGSALSALTGSTDEIPAALAAAHRQARAAVRGNPPTKLQRAATEVQRQAATWGVPVHELQPGLSPTSSGGAASMVLHEAQIPVTRMGMGSVRALAMAVQGLGAHGSIVAIDEVELGLEPHRLRQLVHRLTTRTLAGDEPSPGQIFLTTHSAVAITELQLDSLHVVRGGDKSGTVEVRSARDTFSDDADTGQGLARSNPESFLARTVLVGEGATEVGLLRGLLRHWEATEGLMSTRSGVTTCNGGGDPQAQHRAVGFDRLGYPTLLLLDSDRGPADVLDAVAGHSVILVQWAGGASLEQRLAQDMSDELVPTFLATAMEGSQSAESIVGALSDRLGISQAQLSDDPTRWVEQSGRSGLTFRTALGDAASQGGWFKTVSGGELLADLIVANEESFPEQTDFAIKLKQLKSCVRDFTAAPSAEMPKDDKSSGG